MKPASRLLSPILSAAMCVALGACSIVLGARMDVCGEYPAEGGPAVIVTRDQELCDLVQGRVSRQFAAATDLTESKINELIEKSLSWERKDTMEELFAAVRRDAGDATADEVRRAVESVAAHSKRTTRPECGEVEKCLVKGAARGLRIALQHAQPSKTPPTTEKLQSAPGRLGD